jgi:tetratricopeptide (TPR) repeat protein
MRPVAKCIARYLVAAAFVAAIMAACAPRPSIPPLRPSQPVQMPETGDRQAYRIAEDLAIARSARATDAFENFLARFPASPLAPQALMHLGDLYRNRADLKAAGNAYHRLLIDHRNHPLAPRALVGLLTVNHRQGDFNSLLANSRILPPERLAEADRQQIRQLRIDALLALKRPLEAAEEAIAAWRAASEEDRPKLADQLALALGELSPQALSRLSEKPTTPEARDLLQRLVKDIAFDQTTIGCMLPLSGTYGAYGQRALRGAEMALMHFTARPSAPKVRMIIEDTASRGDRAQAIVQEFSRRRVAAILGPMVTAAEAGAEAQRQAIPIITFTQREDIPALGDWVLRYFITPRNQVEALVSWAMEREGIQRFAVLHPADKYGKSLQAHFAEAVDAHGGTLAGPVGFPPPGTPI